MFTQSVSADLKLVQTFCGQEGIALFYGRLERSSYAPCQWNQDSPNALQDYLAFLQKVGAKVLHLDVMYNELLPEGLKAMQTAIAAGPWQGRGLLNVPLKHLQKEKGSPLTMVAAFLHGGIQYVYMSHGLLYYDYTRLQALVSYNAESPEEGLEQEKPPLQSQGGVPANRTWRQTIDALVRKIATDPLYTKETTERDRRKIAKALALQAGINVAIGQRQVSKMAEQIFTSEIEPARDKKRTKTAVSR